MLFTSCVRYADAHYKCIINSRWEKLRICTDVKINIQGGPTKTKRKSVYIFHVDYLLGGHFFDSCHMFIPPYILNESHKCKNGRVTLHIKDFLILYAILFKKKFLLVFFL